MNINDLNIDSTDFEKVVEEYFEEKIGKNMDSVIDLYSSNKDDNFIASKTGLPISFISWTIACFNVTFQISPSARIPFMSGDGVTSNS